MNIRNLLQLYEPDPDSNDPPSGNPPPAGLSESEFRSVIGEEIDSRMSRFDNLDEKLAKLDILDSFESTFDNLFKKHGGKGNAGSFDKKGLVDEIGSIIDEKLGKLNLSGNGPTVRQPGPLGRFLRNTVSSS